MRTIICGSRTIHDPDLLHTAIDDSGFEITTLISGGAAGVDAMAEHWAKKAGIPVERFIPEWERYGKSAGPRRNQEMAEAAHACIALWDGVSRGTKDMIRKARKEGLRLYVSGC